MMPPLFVSYYTSDFGYEKEAKALLSSAKALDLPIEIEPLSSRGSWEKNCSIKPSFLLKKLEESHRPLVWIDADARLLKPPLLFDSIKAELAFRMHTHLPLDHPSKVLTGTLYLKPTEKVKRLLICWEKLCKKNGGWDQIAFKEALLKENPSNFALLPEAYCAIFDKTSLLKEEIVILHTQASRLLKKIVDQEVITSFLHG